MFNRKTKQLQTFILLQNFLPQHVIYCKLTLENNWQHPLETFSNEHILCCDNKKMKWFKDYLIKEKTYELLPFFFEEINSIKEAKEITGKSIPQYFAKTFLWIIRRMDNLTLKIKFNVTFINEIYGWTNDHLQYLKFTN